MIQPITQPPWRGRIHHDGHHYLYHQDAGCFIPFECTAFGLTREDVGMEHVLAYIDMLGAYGFNGFRSIIGSAWGSNHQAEDGWGWQWGGSQWPIEMQDRSTLNEPLFARIETLLTALRQRGMFLQLEITDGSQGLPEIGQHWFTTPDIGWDLLCQRVALLYADHDNLIVSTGNEPKRWHPDGAAVEAHQRWLVDRLRQLGVDLVAGQIDDSPSIAKMVSIGNVHVPRNKTLWEYYSYLAGLRAQHPGIAIWSNEPDRVGWSADVDQVRRLMWATAIAGCGWTLHGLSSGFPFWGVGPADGTDMMQLFWRIWNSWQIPRRSGRLAYYLDPDRTTYYGRIHSDSLRYYQGGPLYLDPQGDMWSIRAWDIATGEIGYQACVSEPVTLELPVGDWVVQTREGSEVPPQP